MSTRVKGWIVSSIFILLAMGLSVFAGVKIQQNTLYQESAVKETETTESTSEVAGEKTTEIPSEETTESTSKTVVYVREIRDLSQAEIQVIEKKYDGEGRIYSCDGEKSEENISLNVVDTAGDLSSKFEYVKCFDQTEENSCSLYFILNEGTGYANEILDVLKEADIQATFFVDYDFMNDNPEIMERIFFEHHTLGSLGASDPSDGLALYGLETIMEDAYNLHLFILDRYDYTMKQFLFDRNVYRDQAVAVITQMGYDCVFYSVECPDETDEALDANSLFRFMTSSYHKGAIYKLHGVNEATFKMLPNFLEYCEEEGIQVH